jgi:vacuolar-type H+-ATPase subunit H
MVKDCSWCNQKNCPVTENMVSRKNLFFFARSKENLIAEARKRNQECVKVCRKCADQVNKKISNSGQARGIFGERNWRQLSQSEMDRLKEQRDHYSSLAERSSPDLYSYSSQDTIGPQRKQEFDLGDFLESHHTRMEMREASIDEEFEESFEDPETMMNLSNERSRNLEKKAMLVAHERGMNFISYLICNLSAGESPNRMWIPRDLSGEERILFALNPRDFGHDHDPYMVDNGDGTFTISQEIANNYGYLDEEWSWPAIWDEAITRYYPNSFPSYTGVVDPSICKPF